MLTEPGARAASNRGGGTVRCRQVLASAGWPHPLHWAILVRRLSGRAKIRGTAGRGAVARPARHGSRGDDVECRREVGRLRTKG